MQPPDADYLFNKDTNRTKQVNQQKREQILKTDIPVSEQVELQAPNIEYSKDRETVVLSDGLLVTKGGLKVRADKGEIDLKEQIADISGNVFFTWPAGFLTADKANINIDNETGTFYNSELLTEQSDFNVKAKSLNKFSEFDYHFTDTNLSPCLCPDGDRPWSISCSDLKVREEGYGIGKDFRFKVNDQSLIYLPYIAFPFKRERQSGFLAPEIGFNNRDGFRFGIPYFFNVDESTDLIFAPFIQSRTRTGFSLDYNEIFSNKSSIQSRFYYSDESKREGESRGTITSDVFDPTIDTNRFAAYVNQSWNSDSDFLIPMSLVSDIHYISDNLILREFDDPLLGNYNARYATSKMMWRTNYSPLFSTELIGEYNQSIFTDQDLVFQRLPELNIYSQETFRPFGMNPYGLKLVASNKFTATVFDREEGYDGLRYNFNPGLKIPYHYKNFFNGEFNIQGNFTTYRLNNNTFPNDLETEIENDTRDIYNMSFTIGTELEKISDVSDDSLMKWITSLGRENQLVSLKRVRSTIEPKMTLGYTPFEEQDSLPIFDSLDRIRERRFATLGIKSSLFGRFSPNNPINSDILELLPEVNEINPISPLTEIADYSHSAMNSNLVADPRIQKGQVRELFNFSVYQNYDYLEDLNDREPNRTPWSDLGFGIGMYPSNYFAIKFDSNLNVEENDFSSWGVATHFRDDRGDLLRAKYTYLENSISQIEGNIELALSQRLKLGFYSRFDELTSEFIDRKLAFRVTSSCNCWDLDLGYRERLNPDTKDFILSFTLKGLGELAQDFSLLGDQNRQR